MNKIKYITRLLRNNILFFQCMIFITGISLFAQNSVITESEQEFLTYPYSDPNPIAETGRIYPYFRFDGYSHSGQPQKWKIVTMENPFIKVFITPEIGGKIWGAMEKSSGKMFIYNNNVVKFRNIAMRGPWTSGGIESNFGIIGHTPTVSSPVDYIMLNNSDGSVSCVIGALDLITRTTWRVEIRLPKDKAFFEMNVIWHNGTALNQPYYHWMNGAARASDDLQFFFPGHTHIFHDGKSYSWPNDDQGHNLSMYADNNFGSYKSYHVLGEYSGFFGGYYYNDHLGFGNWSTYSDKPGKKLWIWGLSRQGMIWENLLTDSNGQYIEMQSGRLFNQAGETSSETPFKHREFPAYSTDSWSEIWFPVKETEGIKSANNFGVLNLDSNEDQIKIYFSPLQKINDDLSVTIGGKTIYSKHLNLQPLEIFVDSIGTKLSDSILVSVGSNKLSFSPADKKKNSINRPLKSPSNFNWNSIQGLATKGKEAAKQLNYEVALKYYTECLEKDSNYMDALTGIAEIYYRRMEYDKALKYAKHALSIDTYDGEANFIYGMINKKSNYLADAKDGFSIASHSVKYRSAAFAQLAKMYAYKGSWNEALDYSSRALDFNKYNLSAYQVLIIAQRKQKSITDSQKSIDDLLKLDPLNHFARFEKSLLNENPFALQEFKKLIRNELPSETFIELAITYHNLGLNSEALKVLENAPENPIVTYWQAYLNDLSGNSKNSIKLLKIAESQSPYLIFPFRAETADLFSWVITKSNNWKGKYYLALIYWKSENLHKAKELLADCKDEPDYSPFYLARAKVFSKIDISQSIKDTRTAIEFDQNDWRAWIMLSEFYNQNKDHQKSFSALETIYNKDPNDYRFAIPYAKALFSFEKYEKCISILDKIEVLPFEGASDGRVVFHDAHIMSAIRNIENNELNSALIHLDKARTWPENLGAGKPYDPDELLEAYLEIEVRQRINQMQDSKKQFQKMMNKIEEGKKVNYRNNIVAALIMKRVGMQKEAITLLKSVNSSPSNYDLIDWIIAEFSGEKEQAIIKSEKIKINPNLRVYYETIKLAAVNNY